jgi:hypothetical protein
LLAIGAPIQKPLLYPGGIKLSLPGLFRNLLFYHNFPRQKMIDVLGMVDAGPVEAVIRP